MKLTTSLIFNGQTEAAFNHYKSIFGGDFVSPIVRLSSMMPELAGTPEGDRVLYVALDLGNQQLKGNDSTDVPEDLTQTPQNVSLFLEVETEEEGLRLFQGLAEGGQVVYPLAIQPWGDYFGHVIDQFGINWDIKIG